ncbi:MAG: CCA tRNA nucleotidyltransferase, partial [Holosporales bacterium]|nr:CCA tRNA nucleotidyltransferase [Holosporales bacterium]
MQPRPSTITAVLACAQPVLRIIKNAGHEGRLVGGCVRDALLNHTTSDIDIAIDVPPEQTIDIFKITGLKVIPTGLVHGTVTVIHNETPFEITSLRQDVATDGRHAIVKFTKSWEADAARRDFTINALYANDRGQIFDYFDGQADLVRGIVRFIGDPQARISEDNLRILRFYRFALGFSRADENGFFELDEPSLKAVHENVKLLRNLSKERIQSELFKILENPSVIKILHIMPNVFETLFNRPPDLMLGRKLMSISNSFSRKLNCRSVPLLNLFAIYPQNVMGIECSLKLSREQVKFLRAVSEMKDISFSTTNLLAIRIKYGDDIARGWADVRTAMGDMLPVESFDSIVPQFP